MTRVFIADDHLIVREGVRRIVEDAPDLEVCGDAVNGDELVQKLADTSAELLLLDVSMPGPGFLENMRKLTRQYPNLKILVLSAHPEDMYARRAFKAGARGYLTKNHSPDELLGAIKRIAAGGRYVSESLAEKLAFEDDTDADRPLHEQLSQREYQILCLLGAGKPVGDIARDLLLSPKTVSTYRSRILEKLQLNNTSELIHYALNHDLGD